MTVLESPPQASDLMTRKVKTVSPNMTLREVTKYLTSNHLTSAPVVEERDGKPQLVGFLSERDCLSAMAQEGYFGSPAPPQTVSTVMKRAPICVSDDLEVFALASIFIHHGFRQLPVTKEGTLLGIVTRRDVLVAIDKYYHDSNLKAGRERFRPDTHQLVNHRFIVSPT